MVENLNIDDLQIILDSLTDTFIAYLQPDIIINNSPFLERHKVDFFSNQPLSREDSVKKLLEWVQEYNHSTEESAIKHFTETLIHCIQEKEKSIFLHPVQSESEINGEIYVNTCIENVFKTVSRELSQDKWCVILEYLYEKKLISERDLKNCKRTTPSQECCLETYRSIKRHKHDWPFNFYDALLKYRPDWFSLQNNSQVGNPQDFLMSQAMVPHEDHYTVDSASSAGELSSFDTLSTVSNASLEIETFNSNFKENTGERAKLHMTEEDLNSARWQLLIKKGTVKRSDITTEPQHQRKRSLTTSDFNFSDEESSDESNDNSLESAIQPMREYQHELAKEALARKNTIICAPTGSGKTRVAMYVILSHLQAQKEDEPKRKVAFLARTVPLVMQQFKCLKKFLPTPFQVTNLTGDSEDSMHLHMILPDNDVIVMTPRILENHLARNCLPHLGVFSMLIFDECHHTRKGEPYNTLMFSYLKIKRDRPEIKLPQIVGLTASISVEKAVQDDEAVKCILKVLGNLDADCISAVEENELELREKVPVPEEKMLRLTERENDKPVEKIVHNMCQLEKHIQHYAAEIENKELNSYVSKIPTDKKSQQYGQWAVKIKNIAKSLPRNEERETNLSVRYLIIIADYLVAYNVALETHDLVELRDVMGYLEKCFERYRVNEKKTTGEDMCYSLFLALKDLVKRQQDAENPNLTLLKQTLKEYLIKKGDKSSGIIFVRTRALTDALVSWLNRCGDQQLSDLHATVFTGTGPSVEQGGMTQSEQEETIQKFRKGEVRLLVATSVGEEGLDIPECNLVIKYNHVGNEVTTVQTRGRSRKSGGVSILLAMDKIFRKERINQEKAKMMERAIKVIHKMNSKKIRKLNKEHQDRIVKEEEISEMVKKQEDSRLSNKEFKMVCHLCRKVEIENKNIKTIFGAHRVVVDRSILEKVEIKPYKNVTYMDEIQVAGSVVCKGEPEKGKKCLNKLGSMMIFSKVPFVVLGIKYFGFDTGNKFGLEFYNQWKKVPYHIDEIEPGDIARYLPENFSSQSDDDSDEDDSDENSKGQDSKPSVGSSASVKTLTDSSDPHTSITHQIPSATSSAQQSDLKAAPVGIHQTLSASASAQQSNKELMGELQSRRLQSALKDFTEFSVISTTKSPSTLESAVSSVAFSEPNSEDRMSSIHEKSETPYLSTINESNTFSIPSPQRSLISDERPLPPPQRSLPSSSEIGSSYENSAKIPDGNTMYGAASIEVGGARMNVSAARSVEADHNPTQEETYPKHSMADETEPKQVGSRDSSQDEGKGQSFFNLL